MIIISGKFAGFKLIPQSFLGVRSETINVFKNGVIIGYIENKDSLQFIAGDPSVFSPVPSWKLFFGMSLKNKLNLIK